MTHNTLRIFLWSLIWPTLATAQINLTLIVSNPMPGQLSAWEQDRTLLQVIIDNQSGITYTRARMSFVIRSNATGADVAHSNDNSIDIPRFSVPPGMTTLYGTDVLSVDAVTIDEALRTSAVTTNSLPEGDFEICVRLLEENGAELSAIDACRNFSVIIPDPPTLLLPENESVLTPPVLPTFSWSPVLLLGGAQARYRLTIAPMYAGQSVRDAIERNEPVFNQIVATNSYVYQASDPPFSFAEQAVGFAWQVQAVNEADEPATRNDGKSEIFAFTFTRPQMSVEVSPERIDVSAGNPQHEITFTFTLPQSAAAGIELRTYQVTWVDEDANRMYNETTNDLVLDPSIIIQPGQTRRWTQSDTYDEHLREVLLANREQASYRKVFTFFGRDDRAVPVLPVTAPHYLVQFSAPAFAVTADPSILEYNPLVTRRDVTFHFRGSGAGDIHVTRNAATWQTADGARVEVGTTEMNLRVPQGETADWMTGQPFPSLMQCELLDRLGLDETDVTVTYQFDGEVAREGGQTQSVSAMASFAMHVSRGPGNQAFAVSVVPATLEFNPLVTRNDVTFTFQVGCGTPVHVSRYSATWTTADNRTINVEPTQIDINVPQGEGARWTTGQPFSSLMQCDLLDRLGVDETDVTVTYQFDGALQLGGGRTQPTGATVALVMHVRRPPEGNALAVSATPAILRFTPEQTEQPVTFEFGASCADVHITRNAATWTTADNQSVSVDPTVMDLTIPAGTSTPWQTRAPFPADLQQQLLDRLHLDETDVNVLYQFDGELRRGNEEPRPVSATASFVMHVNRAGIAPLLGITATPDQPLRFYPGTTTRSITYEVRLAARAAGPMTFDHLVYTYLENGNIVQGPSFPYLEGGAVTIQPGAATFITLVEYFDDERLTRWLDGRRSRILTLQVEIDGDINGQTVQGAANPLTITLFASADDAANADLILWAIPGEVSFFPGTTSHEISYNFSFSPSVGAIDTLTSVALTYRDEAGTLYRGPIVSPLPRPIILNAGDRTTTSGTLTVDDADRESMLSEGRDTRTLTATAEFSGRNSVGQMIFSASNPITMRIFRTAEAAGSSDYVLMAGVAFIRPTQQTIITTQGERKILNGTGTLVILPIPFDTTEVTVDLLNLTFAPGSGLHLVSGSLSAESPPDSRLFGLLGDIFNVTRLSYDQSRDSTRRFLIEQAYVMFLDNRIDLTDVVVNRDGISLERASIETSLFNFLTLRMTDMRAGKENGKKIIAFTVHGRLKGKPRNEEIGFTSLKFIDGGGFDFHLTPEPAPLRIIGNTEYLRFKDFEAQKDSSTWFLKVTADFSYPPPFASLGPTETFFKIDQDGHMVGEVAPVKEMTPGFAGDRSMVTLGKFAVIDLTYLGLQLSLIDGEIDNATSRVGLACDLYFALAGQDSHRVSVGSPSDPGITIDFDGAVHWQVITIARDKKLKFGPFYVKLSNFAVNPQPDSARPYFVELSGGLGLDFPKVDGEVDFEAMRVTDEGTFDMAHTIVRGGEFTVVDIVHLGLDSLSYSDEPSTITFQEKIGSQKEDRTIETDSHLRLKGASLSVGSAGDGGSGGFEDLLVYTRAEETNFLLRRAKMTIAEVEVKVDCKYITNDPDLGTVLSVAGTVKTPKFEGTVIGKMGRTAEGDDTYGLFLAASGLGLQLGPITLDALGGGFFYNPLEEDLEIVRTNCGIDRPDIRENIAAHRPEGADDPGAFAAMIYAAAFVGSKDAVEGRALMTITENSLALDMEVDVLKKTGHGAAYMIFGWDPAYAEGRITFRMDYPNENVTVLGADAEVDFYAYTSDVWGINGSSTVKLLAFVEADADFFVGPPGFMLNTNLEAGFDVGVLKAEAGFETMVWWQKDVSWGAYARAWAEGEILWGLAGVSGTLEGALIGDPGLIYTVGSFRAEVLWTEVFDGSLWVTVGVDGFDGGLGRNARYDQIIEDARQMADHMEEEMDDLQAAMDGAEHALIAMSDEQVSRAGQSLMTQLTENSLATALYYLSYKTDHDDYHGAETENAVMRDILFGRTPRNRRWWLDTLTTGKQTLATKEQEIQTSISQLAAKKTRMQQRLASYQSLLTGELPAVEDLSCVNPVGQPTYASVMIGGAERRVKNGFAFDTLQAVQNRENAARTKQSRDAYEDRVIQMIQSFTRNIDTIDNILYDGTNAVRNIGHEYTAAFEKVNDYYEESFAYVVRTQNMAAARFNALRGKEADIRQAIAQQSNDVAPNDRSLRRLRTLVDLRRAVIQSMDDSYNPQVREESLEGWKELCDTLGMLMWYRIPEAAFQYLIDNSIASRDTVREVFARTRDSFVGRWAEYTQSLEGIYDRTSRLYELLYDLYDQLSISATRLPISKAAARLLGNPTPRDYYAAARDRIGGYLELPRITSLTGTSRSETDHTARLSLNWSASHPRGIAEYAYHLKYPAPPNQQQGMILMVVGSPLFRSMGSSTRTHLLLAQEYGSGEPDRPGQFEISLKARTRSGYTLTRRGTVDVEYSAGSAVTNNIDAADDTPPSIPAVADEGGYTSSTTMLSAHWSATDRQSDVQEYQYCIETQRALNIGGRERVMPERIRDWTSAGGQTDLNMRDLPLRHGKTYWVKVRASNGVGLWSDEGISDGIIVDTTQPGAPTISEFRRTEVQNGLRVRWTAGQDPESGIEHYEAALGSHPLETNLKEWTHLPGDAITFSFAGVPLFNGDSCVVSLRAVNGAGLTSYSTGSVVISFTDTTAPGPPVIEEALYRQKDSTLVARWSASDRESGISEFQYSLGTSKRGRAAYGPWTSIGMDRSLELKVENLPSAVRIKAINGVRLSSSGTRTIEQHVAGK